MGSSCCARKSNQLARTGSGKDAAVGRFFEADLQHLGDPPDAAALGDVSRSIEISTFWHAFNASGERPTPPAHGGGQASVVVFLCANDDVDPTAPAVLRGAPAGSLYEQVIGESFAVVHPAVRQFHRVTGRFQFKGTVLTDAPTSRLAGLLARILGTPLQASTGPLLMHIAADSRGEVWTRRFPHGTMTSRMRVAAGRLVEQLGPVRLSFDLAEESGRLVMRLVGLHFLGIPCPRPLLPRIRAEERGSGTDLHFDVSAALPLAGTVASYRGWLVVLHRESD